MNKGLVIRRWAAAMIIILAVGQASMAQYSGGDGLTEETAFQISKAADWLYLMKPAHSGDWNKYFILTNDIDFGGITLTPVARDTSTSSGHQGTKFTGVFDGNGHVLRYATINMTGTVGQDYVGLFGYVDTGGQIRNLGVENINITGRYYVGGLVGENTGGLTYCYATGVVSGDRCVGGLVGENYYGTVTSCYATGDVSGTGYYVGGLVGWNSGTLTDCYALGVVRGTWYVGGLLGENYKGIITNCYATGAVIGTGNSVGGLVGYNENGTISSCYATGAVSGFSSVGGLVGWNNGTLNYCYATGTVSGTGSSIGGLVGDNRDCIVTSCYATGAVSGGSYVGGLVGRNYGMLTSCYATGTVSGISFVGGLVGRNYGMLTSCYATGNVSGTDYFSYVGGLVGDNWNGTITSCYATGAVTSNGDYVGVLVGCNSGTLTACYAMGAVNGTERVGGLVGKNYGTVASCFWDMETSGLTNSAGGKGLTTGQMKTMSIFQNAGWAGRGWVMEDGLDYPHLAWENTPGVPIPAAPPVPLNGAGTENDPYQVQTPADFALLSWHVSIPDKHIKLMTDIDLAGVLLYPVGDLGSFTGVFDGAGHVIRNAVIKQPTRNRVGLFDYLGSGGQIRHLGVEDADITGQDSIGGLVGENYGMITFCYATGVVSGNSDVGGLVGSNYGTLTSCYATGTVSGTGPYIGGLVGDNRDCIVTSCYATGVVSGDRYVGGLVGNNGGTLDSCYATGTVSGSNRVGGLVGWNYYGSLTSCCATGAVSGVGSVGGLVGLNSSTISFCYATGNVSGTDYFSNVGGLVGDNWNGTITSCYATGAVRGTLYVGGLVGYNRDTLNSCYATGAVSGTGRYVGGLVGYNTVTITTCYATGTVSGTGRYVGGLVGYNYQGKVIHCYSTGKPTGTSNVGGLCGSVDTGGGYEDTGNFWDTQTSEIASSAMGTGKTTAQMKTRSTFINAKWDFVNETANGAADIWYIYENISYPLLRWQNHRPVADAGSDRTIYAATHGVAQITLDGSGSYDLDGDPLTWHWSWTIAGQEFTSSGADGKVDLRDFAALAKQWRQNEDLSKLYEFSLTWLNTLRTPGYNPQYDTDPHTPYLTLELPIGVHAITLTVNDGIENSPPDEVVITVLHAGDLDRDDDVDIDDLTIVLAGRNTPAAGPDDPRDLDRDGLITILDARILVTLFTNE